MASVGHNRLQRALVRGRMVVGDFVGVQVAIVIIIVLAMIIIVRVVVVVVRFARLDIIASAADFGFCSSRRRIRLQSV